MTYRIQRVASPELGIDFDAPVWRDLPVAEISHHMGERPAHFPRTRVRVGYDAAALYVMFCVEDRYVRAIATQHQGEVWKDSCVEFFFCPGEPSCGYFNLEMNCGGTMLLRHQVRPWEQVTPVAAADLEQIHTCSSLPQRVEPEITDPVTWTLACRLPIALIVRYCPAMQPPAPGVVWRGNFYKCAEHNSHPHWLTWAPVDHPVPNFHLPAFFGKLSFV